MKGHPNRPRPSLIMEGADVFDATEALQNGEEARIGWYLDAAEILSRISDLLDPPNTSEFGKNLQFGIGRIGGATDHAEMPEHALREWVGSRAQVEEAIEANAPRPLGWYLRYLGDFLSRLGPAFNAPAQSRNWRLQ